MLNIFHIQLGRYALEQMYWCSSQKICVRYSTESAYSKQRWLKPAGREIGTRIYQCGTRTLVPVILHNDFMASWYTCGPTVYDSAHIGHASCYIKVDIVQRILRNHFHVNLVTAMNITDIDDKIIKKSEISGTPWQEISKHFEAEFWSDMSKLNVVEPNLKVRVTENIPKIVDFIAKIISKDLAYVGRDSSVYFDVKKFPEYGKLQRVHLNACSPNNDIDENKNKETAADFVLWKAKKTSSEPSWPSPWGEGRPGWHIECSALASMIFGGELDFHAGGLDLKFPHHENEEAQSCVYHGTHQWVNYWLHTGQLNVKGDAEKMSKSLKNTISIDQMLQQHSADQFRMACLLSNYRNVMEYSDSVMENAGNVLRKFVSFRDNCKAYYEGKKRSGPINPHEIFSKLSIVEKQVDQHFKDDFNTSRAIEVLLDLTSEVNRCLNIPPTTLSTTPCFDAIVAVDNFISKCLSTFGLQTFEKGTSIQPSGVDITSLLGEILLTRKSIREKATLTKNKELFKICDELRNCLKNSGIDIKDHDNGSSWTFSVNKV